MSPISKGKKYTVKRQIVVGKPEISDRLLEEWDVIADCRPKRGRKETSLLGTERKQLDLIVGVMTLNMLEAEIYDRGLAIGPDMDRYLVSDLTRRQFVGALLTSNSRFKLDIVPGAPIETLFKSCGRYIRMRIDGPIKRPGPGFHRYVTKQTAGEWYVRAAFTAQRDAEAARAIAAGAKLEAHEDAFAAGGWGGLSFEEAMQQERARRQAGGQS